jgi:hypothetical protein
MTSRVPPDLGISSCEGSHRRVDVAFDGPNLIADAGLVPLVALAEQIGLPELILEHLAIVDADNSADADARCKVMSLVAGMAAGADSIEDIDRFPAYGNRWVFGEMRTPSTRHYSSRS